jgi:hypothetical protein
MKMALSDCITLGKKLEIQEQESLGGGAKTDFVIGSIAIEVKKAGVCQPSKDRYRKYKNLANNKGWDYLYLSLVETCRPYRKDIFEAVGREKVFFLDTSGSWKSFIKRIVTLLRQ